MPAVRLGNCWGARAAGTAATRPGFCRTPGRMPPSRSRAAATWCARPSASSSITRRRDRVGDVEALAQVDRPGIPLLVELLAQLREDPPASTGAAAGEVAGSSRARPTVETAVGECLVADAESAASEVRSAVARLIAEHSRHSGSSAPGQGAGPDLGRPGKGGTSGTTAGPGAIHPAGLRNSKRERSRPVV